MVSPKCMIVTVGITNIPCMFNGKYNMGLPPILPPTLLYTEFRLVIFQQ